MTFTKTAGSLLLLCALSLIGCAQSDLPKQTLQKQRARTAGVQNLNSAAGQFKLLVYDSTPGLEAKGQMSLVPEALLYYKILPDICQAIDETMLTAKAVEAVAVDAFRKQGDDNELAANKANGIVTAALKHGCDGATK